MILCNEDNTKLLLTIFLEVFAKTCTLHYTSFCQLQQRANTGVFQDSATASNLLSDATTQIDKEPVSSPSTPFVARSFGDKQILVRGCTPTAPVHFKLSDLWFSQSAHPPISISASFEAKKNTIPCPRLDMQGEDGHVNARLVKMSGLATC